MKTISIKSSIILIGLSMLFTACFNFTTIIPSSSVTTQEHSISNYSGVEVSYAFNVDVQFSATEERIEVEVNENLHPYVEVEKVNNNLRIKFKNGFHVKGNPTLKVHIITNKYVDYYAASGASRIVLSDSLFADDVTVSLSGASFFAGTISSNTLSTFIEGASKATLSGKTNSLRATISGASLLKNYDMETEHANLDLSGASQANLTVNSSIDLSASGASVLKYQGGASIDHLNLSGASQIIKMD